MASWPEDEPDEPRVKSQPVDLPKEPSRIRLACDYIYGKLDDANTGRGGGAPLTLRMLVPLMLLILTAFVSATWYCKLALKGPWSREAYQMESEENASKILRIRRFLENQ